MWKNFFYFTKREKSGLIFLIILISGIFAGKFFLGKSENQLPEELRVESGNTVENSTAETTSEQEKQSLYNESHNNSYNKPYNSSYNNSNKNTRNNRNNNWSNNSNKNLNTKQDEKRTYFNNQQNNSYKTNDSIRNVAKIDKQIGRASCRERV